MINDASDGYMFMLLLVRMWSRELCCEELIEDLRCHKFLGELTEIRDVLDIKWDKPSFYGPLRLLSL